MATKDGDHSKKMLSEKQVEELYSFHVRTLQRWRYIGVGPTYVKAGRRVFYREIDLEEFITSNLHISQGNRKY